MGNKGYRISLRKNLKTGEFEVIRYNYPLTLSRNKKLPKIEIIAKSKKLAEIIKPLNKELRKSFPYPNWPSVKLCKHTLRERSSFCGRHKFCTECNKPIPEKQRGVWKICKDCHFKLIVKPRMKEMNCVYIVECKNYRKNCNFCNRKTYDQFKKAEGENQIV